MLRRADTLDYIVMDVATSYQQYLRDKEEAKRKGVAPTAPNLPLNTLKDMMERVRGNDGQTD